MGNKTKATVAVAVAADFRREGEGVVVHWWAMVPETGRGFLLRVLVPSP